jgi:hypothetical protein
MAGPSDRDLKRAFCIVGDRFLSGGVLTISYTGITSVSDRCDWEHE